MTSWFEPMGCPPICADEIPEGVGVVHVWAVWSGVDRTMAERLWGLKDCFGPDFWLHNLDFGPEHNWGLLRSAEMVTLPTLLLMEDGRVSERFVGLRSPDELRTWLVECRASYVSG